MDRKYKFCMVTTFYPPHNFGGDGMFVHRLSNELARRGHHVDVIHCKDAYLLFESKGPKGAFSNHPGVRVYGLKSRVGFLSPLLTHQTGFPFFKGFLRKMLKENQYDVIHYHNMSLIGITALGYGNGIKLYTPHEYWLLCPMHVLWRYNREVCNKKTCVRCTLAGKRPPQFWRYSGLLEKMLRHVDLFLSPSRFTKTMHLLSGLNIPIVHMPLFVPTPRRQGGEPLPDQAPPNHGHPFFLFVGRLEKIKGLQYLITTFKKLPQHTLLIAGDGEYGWVLRKLAAGAKNITFLGRLDYQTLQNLYRQTTAVIVPSICYDVSPITIYESFSMKTPVIGNAIGGIPELVQDSMGGFLYHNEEELISAMEVLATQLELRRKLGDNAFHAFRKYWSEDAHMERYLDLIRGIQEARMGMTEASRIDHFQRKGEIPRAI
jgi:glycosyltransferase involved in cell wall biosynthesis